MWWEAQTVMLLRGLRMAQGGAKAEAEVQRMITEKVAALTEAQVAATMATLKGSKKHRVAKKALGVYARGVVGIGEGSQSKGTAAAAAVIGR